MRSVEGKIAVVTGGGSGIGRATALNLAARGGRVVIADIDAARAAAVAEEVDAAGGRGLGVRCDVADIDEVRAAFEATMSAFGGVDIVMSNVGILAKGLPLEIPLDAWATIVDVNLLGTVRVLQTFLPPLLAQGSGHVVTTGSTAGLFPYAYDRLPYAATKGAVVTMTEALALYLRPQGIGVSCLCPAGVITNIVEQIRGYGEPTPVQAPQVPIITAEEAGELVVQGILDDQLLILTHPVAADLVRRHGADRQAFLDQQLEQGVAP